MAFPAKFSWLFIFIFLFSQTSISGFSQHAQPLDPDRFVHLFQQGDFKGDGSGHFAGDAIVWHDTLSEASAALWTYHDQSGHGGWTHTYQGSQGQFSSGNGAPLASPSAHNGFLILDADYINTPYDPYNIKVIDAYVQSPAIDLSDHEYVFLEFFHYFRYFSGAQLVVSVSNDGDTWVDWDVKGDVPVNQHSQNPIHEVINISEVAGGQETVFVRFQWKGSHWYFWQVDDVAVTTITQNDMALEGAFAGLLSQVPLSQVLPVSFGGFARNRGAATQTDVTLTVDVNDGLFAAASEPVNAPYQFFDTLFTSPTFLPENQGWYQARFELTQSQQDENPADNTWETGFMVTDSVFARDNDLLTGRAHAGAGAPYIMALMYEVPQPALAGSVSFVLSETNQPGVVGRSVRVIIFEITKDLDAIIVGRSENYAIQQSDIPSGPGQAPVAVTLPVFGVETGKDGQLKDNPDLPVTIGGYYLSGPWTGQPKQYLAAFQQYGGTPTIYLGTSPAVYQPSRIWWMFTDQWYAVFPGPSWPMIRLHVHDDECPWLFVEEEITPASGESSADGAIHLTLEGGSPPYTFQWNDPAGSQSQNLLNVAPGTYTITITDSNGCEWQRTFQVGVQTSVPEVPVPGYLHVFPNPFKDQLHLNLFIETADVVSLRVVNLQGQVVFRKEISTHPGEMEITLDSGAWPRGTYILEMSAPGATTARKIIKK
jgi:hypothetical protein